MKKNILLGMLSIMCTGNGMNLVEQPNDVLKQIFYAVDSDVSTEIEKLYADRKVPCHELLKPYLCITKLKKQDSNIIQKSDIINLALVNKQMLKQVRAYLHLTFLNNPKIFSEPCSNKDLINLYGKDLVNFYEGGRVVLFDAPFTSVLNGKEEPCRLSAWLEISHKIGQLFVLIQTINQSINLREQNAPFCESWRKEILSNYFEMCLIKVTNTDEQAQMKKWIDFFKNTIENIDHTAKRNTMAGMRNAAKGIIVSPCYDGRCNALVAFKYFDCHFDLTPELFLLLLRMKCIAKEPQ
jgi:hypothetical protein